MRRTRTDKELALEHLRDAFCSIRNAIELLDDAHDTYTYLSGARQLVEDAICSLMPPATEVPNA